MAIYVLRDGSGCVVDVFGPDQFLAIQINYPAGELRLFSSDLDAVETPCILTAGNSLAGWRELAVAARAAITRRD
jgi:hypothetical protein